MNKFLVLMLGLVASNAAFADTETVKWYVDRTLYDTTTCQSGGDINLPTAPSKYGYTFTGWTGIYDLSTLDTSIKGDVYYAIVDTGQCWYRTSSMSAGSQINCTNENFTDLSAGLWKTKFSYGTVYGTSKCSSTAGTTMGESGNPVDATGQYCWCYPTGFVPDGEDMLYEPAVSLWVFYNSSGSTSECASNCAHYCGDLVQGHSAFRAGLFGSVAN